MNLFIRFVLGIYAFLTLLLTASVLLTVTDTYNPIDAWLTAQQANEGFWIIIGILSFIGLLSLIFLIQAFSMKRSSHSKYVAPTDIGVIGISKASIESTVPTIIRRFDGLRSVKVDANILSKSQQVLVNVRYTPFGTSPVQENAKKLQETIKTELEKWLEIPVKEVKIAIENEPYTSKKQERVI